MTSYKKSVTIVTQQVTFPLKTQNLINLTSDKRRKMFKSYDMQNGLPPRLYRTPGEIKRDIVEISDKIEETNEMLNIRSLITEILLSERRDSPDKLIPELETVIYEAREALSRLRELNEELSLLEEELGEAGCLRDI